MIGRSRSVLFLSDFKVRWLSQEGGFTVKINQSIYLFIDPSINQSINQSIVSQSARADPGICYWGGPNFGSERTVEFFLGGGGGVGGT